MLSIGQPLSGFPCALNLIVHLRSRCRPARMFVQRRTLCILASLDKRQCQAACRERVIWMLGSRHALLDS